ncbi:GNAT family N-acetyltransferase [Altibacter sp. HG106]|uniref:GNAT family N-acetyltransferase n=1 Tax=Altibacter sp. HG106 TaxID=3023937 RepID=UPI0023502944|nr:GNAT family N-acetyltransferase [Altibacter sp. HG106]MDC7995678.1 GNAT family N-acetyltransferase [Altibacter sp. HG106]
MARTWNHNKAERQYEMQLDEQMAKLEYKRKDNKVYLIHTEVPDAFEGQGIGSELVERSLQDIETESLKIVPWCPFVVHYLKEHTQWQRLLADHVTLPS